MAECTTWKRFRQTAYGKRIRNAVYERDNHTCQYCGAHVIASYNATIDHIVARSAGGDITNPANMITACTNCNSRKRDLSVIDYCELAGLPYNIALRINEQRHKPIVP